MKANSNQSLRLTLNQITQSPIKSFPQSTLFSKFFQLSPLDPTCPKPNFQPSYLPAVYSLLCTLYTLNTPIFQYKKSTNQSKIIIFYSKITPFSPVSLPTVSRPCPVCLPTIRRLLAKNQEII